MSQPRITRSKGKNAHKDDPAATVVDDSPLSSPMPARPSRRTKKARKTADDDFLDDGPVDSEPWTPEPTRRLKKGRQILSDPTPIDVDSLPSPAPRENPAPIVVDDSDDTPPAPKHKPRGATKNTRAAMAKSEEEEADSAPCAVCYSKRPAVDESMLKETLYILFAALDLQSRDDLQDAIARTEQLQAQNAQLQTELAQLRSEKEAPTTTAPLALANCKVVAPTKSSLFRPMQDITPDSNIVPTVSSSALAVPTSVVAALVPSPASTPAPVPTPSSSNVLIPVTAASEPASASVSLTNAQKLIRLLCIRRLKEQKIDTKANIELLYSDVVQDGVTVFTARDADARIAELREAELL